MYKIKLHCKNKVKKHIFDLFWALPSAVTIFFVEETTSDLDIGFDSISDLKICRTL